MFVTVLICTHGRGASIASVLETLFTEANLSEPDWEVLVIVRKDTEIETVRVCNEFCRKYRDRFFLKEVPAGHGKSAALNLGIAEARGEILAMTDDDVLVAPDFIRNVREFFGAHPAADAVQGRVLLDFDGPVPSWMNDELLRSMSLRDRGDASQDWEHSLTGTNMLVKASAARAVGGFSVELGAGMIGFCEDLDFSIRLRKAGYRFFYAPDILVRHQMVGGRCTPPFFRRRYFFGGRSQAYLERPPAPFWRYALWVAKECGFGEVKAAWHWMSGRTGDALIAQCHARSHLGTFYQEWLFRRGASRKLTRANFSKGS
jgi:GT2 family glycosyltransferase